MVNLAVFIFVHFKGSVYLYHFAGTSFKNLAPAEGDEGRRSRQGGLKKMNVDDLAWLPKLAVEGKF